MRRLSLAALTMTAVGSLTVPAEADTERATSFIAQYEGFRPVPYNDEAGFCTVGYGELLHRSKCDGTEASVTPVEGRLRLRRHIKAIRGHILSMVKVELSPGQLDALTSLCFNMGVSRIGRSTLIKKLNAGDRKGASEQFLVWRKAAGKVNKGLMKRRAAERRMFDE